jgi:Ca2+-binding RTX toxin-like protein
MHVEPQYGPGGALPDSVTVCGGPGDDRFQGADVADGGPGNDFFDATTSVRVTGGPGADTFFAPRVDAELSPTDRRSRFLDFRRRR